MNDILVSNNVSYEEKITSLFSIDLKYDSWYAVLLSSTIWILFYLTVKGLFPEKSPEWCSRFVTLVHGTGSAFTSFSECFSKYEEVFTHQNDTQTQNQQVILLVSLGYFAFDLIWCLFYQTESALMLLHHAFSCFGLYRMLWRNNAGLQTCCGIGGMECTNPLLQMRWFMRNSGYAKWFFYSEIIFILSFFIMRLGFGTYFFINVIFLHENDWEYMLFTSMLYLISLLFLVNIIQYVVSKYISTKEPKNL